MSKTLKRVLMVCMIIAVIAVIAASVYALMNRKTATNTNDNTNTTNTTNQISNQNTNTVANTNDGGATNVNAVTNTNVPVTNVNANTDQASVLRLARIFAERYGTFSNRNNFENIITLEPFMTEAFQKTSAEYINKNQTNGIEQEFYGITTTVASLEMTEYTQNASATVRIATRRVETKGSSDPTVATQYIRIGFQNVEGSWKVSSATWE